jgi:hypothetical protein
MATRDHNIMKPPNANYEIIIKTISSDGAGGTDALLTFTIRGQSGQAVKQADSSLTTRMESGDWNTSRFNRRT